MSSGGSPGLLSPGHAGAVTVATEAPRRWESLHSGLPGLAVRRAAGGWDGVSQGKRSASRPAGAGGARAGLNAAEREWAPRKPHGSGRTQAGPRQATSGPSHTHHCLSFPICTRASDTYLTSTSASGPSQLAAQGRTQQPPGPGPSLTNPPSLFQGGLSQEAVRAVCSVTFSCLEGGAGCLSVLTGRGTEKAHLEIKRDASMSVSTSRLNEITSFSLLE